MALLTAVSLCLITLGLRPTEAGAAAPVKGGSYDGGDNFALQVNVAGTKVQSTFLNFKTRCNGRLLTGSTSVPRNLRIRNGRFSFANTINFPSSGGAQKQRGRGRFIAGRRVVFLYRQTIDNPVSGQHCDTGTLRLVARAGAFSPYQVGAYDGSTSKGRDVSFSLIETGYVERFKSELRLACDSGPDRNERVFFDSLRLRAGQFSVKDRVDTADGYTITELKGTLAGTRVTGFLRATGSFVIGYTGEFDDIPIRANCDSGPIRFTARK
ncbi:MAG: hypothetical protein JJE13_03175 [Thermoleophilia bacterium]|nr:hypothetical protein [Thermoleophilia bacterium]